MLNRKVSVTVPGTDHGQPIKVCRQSDAVDEALRALSRWFGGATAIKGQGAWVSDDGSLVVEPVVVVYAYCDDASLATHRRDVEMHARQLAHDLGQEAVAVEWPEGMEFCGPMSWAVTEAHDLEDE